MQRLRRESAALIAGGLWALVAVIVRATGQAFNADYLGYGWQLVPYEVLRADPLGSVWNLHIQPPLFNLAIGALGRWSPLGDIRSFELMQLVLGAVMTAALASTARHLGLRRWVAAAVALLATLSPDVLRNVLEPTYEIAVGALLAIVAWILARHRTGDESRSLLLLSGVLTVVVLTRSLYHPIWLIVILGLAGWHWRSGLTRRAVVVASLIPLILVGGWMLKNQVMFGRATTSSWFGMNLQRAVIPVLPEADRIQMFNDGEISEIAMIGPFGNYDLYRNAVEPCTPAHDHPALTTEIRQYAVVVPNLNFECFLPVYDQAGADARAVIRKYPGVWLDGRTWSMRTWFASNQLADSSPSWPLRQLGRVYHAVHLDVPGELSTSDWGQPIYGRLAVETKFSLTSLHLTLMSVLVGLVETWRIIRRRRAAVAVTADPISTDGAAPGYGLVVAFTGLTVAFTFAVGVIGELGEQARFRTMTDPVMWAIGGVVILRWAAHRFGWTRLIETSRPPAEPSR